MTLCIICISCQPNQDKADLTEDVAADPAEKVLNPEEEEIIAAVEKLLFAAGNYNIHDLDEMTSDKAMIGVSILKDGVWSNSEITIDEYFESVRNREPRPYCEIPTDYDIDKFLHFCIPQRHQERKGNQYFVFFAAFPILGTSRGEYYISSRFLYNIQI
jgi:hypothetical protein